MVTYTVPGLKTDIAERIAALLQDRLNSLSDLALTLKHVHWNVTGPNFIAVHTMLDPQVDAVRAMVDETAERIAALGASPCGTPGALVAQRDWDDYSIGRAWHAGASRRAGRRLRRDHRGASSRCGRHRRPRPGHTGHAHRAVPSAGGVPLVHPCPPGSARRIAHHWERQHREDGREASQEAVSPRSSDRTGRGKPSPRRSAGPRCDGSRGGRPATATQPAGRPGGPGSGAPAGWSRGAPRRGIRPPPRRCRRRARAGAPGSRSAGGAGPSACPPRAPR